MKFQSDRYFTIFDFFISHGQLLIRASKNDTYNTNIDILFFDVKFMQLKTYLSGVSIQRVEDVASNIIDSTTNLNLEQIKIFEIESERAKFYVASSFIHVYENELEFNETSLGVLTFKGRDKLLFELG